MWNNSINITDEEKEDAKKNVRVYGSYLLCVQWQIDRCLFLYENIFVNFYKYVHTPRVNINILCNPTL